MPSAPHDPTPQDVDVDKPLNKRRALLEWYDAHGRVLPWREKSSPARAPDPYKIWVSEIMLQQTTVAATIPYFTRFMAAFPDLKSLAQAPLEEVLRLWAGLGYYARARSLHRAAQALAALGNYPQDEAGWRRLPGIGPYTGAAIAAIAYDQPANVVDGNVERVMARLHAVEAPLPGAKAQLRELAGALVGVERPGDYAQALMDLGATICTPRSPNCPACPWAIWCRGLATGAPARFPLKSPKAARPHRQGIAFALLRKDAVFLIRRPPRGLLGAMPALPSTPWREEGWDLGEALAHAPSQAHWRPLGDVAHVFTHFSLTLSVWTASGDTSIEGAWTPIETLPSAGLPSVFAKAAALILADRN
jgi:A/G-specific adenine glycosylase